MTIDFENRYILTEELLLEFNQTLLNSRGVIQLCRKLLRAFLIFGLFSLGFLQSMPVRTKFVLICFPLLWFVGVEWWTRAVVKKNAGQMKEQHNGEMPRVVVTAGEELTVHYPVTGETQHFAYSQISRVLTSENLYILLLSSGIPVLLKKRAFSQGQEMLFLRHIQRKRSEEEGEDSDE